MPERGGNTPEEQDFLERERRALQDLIATANREALQKKLREVKENAHDIRGEARERERTRKLRNPLGGKIGEESSLKHKAALTDLNVKEVLKAFKSNNNLIPVPLNTARGRVIKNLIDRIENPDAELSPLASSFLYKLISDQINNPLEALREDELGTLHSINSRLFLKVVDSLAKAGKDSGRPDEEVNKFIERAMQKERARSSREEQSYELFFDERDREIIEKLDSVEGFDAYVQEVKDAIVDQHRQQGRILSEEELGRLTGEEIETKIVLLFSKLYRGVDDEKASEFWQEIIRAGFMESIESTSDRLKRKLRLLRERLEQGAGNVPEELSRTKFYRRFITDKTIEREIDDGHGGRKRVIQNRVIPTAGYKEAINSADFLAQVMHQVEEEISTREYLHNVRALYLKGAQKDGYWPTLAGYAEKMGMTDVDSILLLPDSDIFMTATRLYAKYIEEEFAKYNWIHQSTMFSREINDVRTQIENRVLADLKILFRGKVGNDEWRLRRAVNMGVGLAKGVFMNEVETAAWAEPHLDSKGDPTYHSYYTNDNVALAPLNPMHHFFRWQAEGVINGPILFLPVAGFKPGFWNSWDHKDLWKKMNEFKKSFLSGQSAYSKRAPGERLLIDILPNIGRVGGFITRGGWRNNPAYEGWLSYKTENSVLTDKLDHLKSWKALENIGFEMLLHYSNDKIKDDFLEPKPSDATAIGERDGFFKYIYAKHINHEARGDDSRAAQGLAQEVSRLKEKARSDIEAKVQRGEIKQSKMEEELKKAQSDKEIYRKILFRALAGALTDRLPTKLIRIERNRTTTSGERAWMQLQRHFASTAGWSPDEFDRVMKSLMLVETQVRKEITEKMKSHLRSKSAEEMTLHDFETNDYVVDDTAIDRSLPDVEQRSKAKALLQQIRSQYLTESTLEGFAHKLRNKAEHFPFALGTEELETTFLAYRQVGESVLARALRDTGGVESNVFNSFKELMGSFQSASVDAKHDMSKIIGAIDKIKKELESIHGLDLAYEVAHHLAGLTIAYFKKDTVGRIPGANLFTGGSGKPRSIAAEFVGPFRGVWEWNVQEIDAFIVELERHSIIRKEPYDLSKGSPREDVYMNLFGKKIKIGEKLNEPTIKLNWSGKLREDFGATKLNLIAEISGTYIPIAVLIILAKMISEALKEAEGQKK